MKSGFKLVFPTLEYKDRAIDYINEFNVYESEINGSGALDEHPSWENEKLPGEFTAIAKKDMKGADKWLA